MWDIVDIEGKDDVVSGMEVEVEKQLSNAVEWLMSLSNYNIRQ